MRIMYVHEQEVRTNNYVGSDVALFDRMLMRHDLKYTLAHINKNTGTGDNMSSFQL